MRQSSILIGYCLNLGHNNICLFHFTSDLSCFLLQFLQSSDDSIIIQDSAFGVIQCLEQRLLKMAKAKVKFTWEYYGRNEVYRKGGKSVLLAMLERFSIECRNSRLLGFVLFRSMIGLQNSRQFFNQSEAKPKTIATRSPAFSRAWRRLHVFASTSDWPIAPFVCCDWSGQLLWFRFYDTQMKSALLQ